jgi:hypothetical protein
VEVVVIIIIMVEARAPTSTPEAAAEIGWGASVSIDFSCP